MYSMGVVIGVFLFHFPWQRQVFSSWLHRISLSLSWGSSFWEICLKFSKVKNVFVSCRFVDHAHSINLETIFLNLIRHYFYLQCSRSIARPVYTRRASALRGTPCLYMRKNLETTCWATDKIDVVGMVYYALHQHNMLTLFLVHKSGRGHINFKAKRSLIMASYCTYIRVFFEARSMHKKQHVDAVLKLAITKTGKCDRSLR